MKWFYLKNASGKISQLKNETDSSDKTGLIEVTNSQEMFAILGEDYLKTSNMPIEKKVLFQSNFNKLAIRRAMRALEIEAVLDGILDSSETFKKDWNDATEINLDDELVKQALNSMNIDTDAIKIKTLEFTNL